MGMLKLNAMSLLKAMVMQLQLHLGIWDYLDSFVCSSFIISQPTLPVREGGSCWPLVFTLLGKWSNTDNIIFELDYEGVIDAFNHSYIDYSKFDVILQSWHQ